MQTLVDRNILTRRTRLAALMIMAVCLIGFTLLAVEVRTDSAVVRFDQAFATALHQGATPGLTVAMRALTLFGLQVLWVLLALAGLFLLLRRRWLLLAMVVITWMGGVVINAVSKELFGRPRPVFDAPLLTATFYSFPSGHAMLSAIVYGLLAYLLARRTSRPGLRLAIFAGSAVVIFLVAFSRLYLGVHYFSDVVGGILLGAAWLMLCILGLEIASKRLRTYHTRRQQDAIHGSRVNYEGRHDGPDHPRQGEHDRGASPPLGRAERSSGHAE